jgi:hypothetical protein
VAEILGQHVRDDFTRSYYGAAVDWLLLPRSLNPAVSTIMYATWKHQRTGEHANLLRGIAGKPALRVVPLSMIHQSTHVPPLVDHRPTSGRGCKDTLVAANAPVLVKYQSSW